MRTTTPGPAPPRSWLDKSLNTYWSSYTPPSRSRLTALRARNLANKAEKVRFIPHDLCGFLHLVGEHVVQPGSLLHCSLRTAAENWGSIAEDGWELMSALPVRLRVLLLSYITKYGPPGGIDMSSLEALIQNDEDITCLDLSGLFGWGFQAKELSRLLTPSSKRRVEPVSDAQPVAESWDEEGPDEGVASPIPAALTQSRLPFLTKLSLAHAPKNISWVDLLSLSKHLHTITHLSIAYWPPPTRTPNMDPAAFSRDHGPPVVVDTGSLYGATLREFTEAAIVLRQLSEHTYCLRWLDLEGCQTWTPALVYLESSKAGSSGTQIDWISSQRSHGPDWSGAWKQIAYLNLRPDWRTDSVPLTETTKSLLPLLVQLEQRKYPFETERLQVCFELADYHSTHPEKRVRPAAHCAVCHADPFDNCRVDCKVCEHYLDVGKREFSLWLEREVDARNIARRIRSVRKGTNSALCTVDLGWKQL